GQPAVPHRAGPLQHRVDVAADEDGRPRALHGAGHHHRLPQVELVDLEGDALLGPEAHQDVEVALELPAALLERHAHRVELARVPARRDAEDETATGDHV